MSARLGIDRRAGADQTICIRRNRMQTRGLACFVEQPHVIAGIEPLAGRRSMRKGICRDQIAPPTLNLDNPSVETAIDLVPHKAREREINVALSNSFGFGGTNATIVMKRLDA